VLVVMGLTASGVWWYANRTIDEKLEGKDNQRESALAKERRESLAQIEGLEKELSIYRRIPQDALEQFKRDAAAKQRSMEEHATKLEREIGELKRSPVLTAERLQNELVETQRVLKYSHGNPDPGLPALKDALVDNTSLIEFCHRSYQYTESHGLAVEKWIEFYKPFIAHRFEWAGYFSEASVQNSQIVALLTQTPTPSVVLPMFPCYFDADGQRPRVSKIVRGQQVVVRGVMGVGYLAKCEVIWALSHQSPIRQRQVRLIKFSRLDRSPSLAYKCSRTQVGRRWTPLI
jgi:hypothetical protein